LCRLQLNRVNSAHARQLDEIRTERDLLAAENGKLSAENGKLSAENGKLSAENGKLSAEKVKLVVEKDQFVSELADATLKQFNFETEIMTLSTRLKSVIPQHGVQPPPPAHARERNPIFEFSNSIHYALSSRGRFDSFEHVVGWCTLSYFLFYFCHWHL
jgi:cell division protein FtsB